MAAVPRFDVVIPTYERPGLLTEAVASAVGQRAPGVRTTVADNASGPSTAEVLDAFGARVTHRRYDEHLPYQRNMSRAKELIDAPHGMVLHDDDVLDADYVETAVDAFDRHPGAGMVVLAARPLVLPGAQAVPFVSTYRWAVAMGFEPDGEGPAGPEIVLPPGALTDAMSSIPWMCPYWPTVSLRAGVFRDAGPYDAGIQTLIDVDMWMRVGARHPVVLIDAVRCSYRFHAGSKSAEFTSVEDDVFVRDVLHIYAKERAGEAGWHWTDEQSVRWLSFAMHRAARAGAAEQNAQYTRLDLGRHGVPLRDLIREQLEARLLWRRTLAPDRGALGALADLWIGARVRWLSR